jgi:hypothetical protein
VELQLPRADGSGRATLQTSKTNGKAERFIKTALGEGAYARGYQTSDQRADHLPDSARSCNRHHPRGGIGSQRPVSRLGMNGDKLLRLHSYGAAICSALS